jgi:hypothetical protein
MLRQGSRVEFFGKRFIVRIQQLKSLTPLVKILAGGKQGAKKTKAIKSRSKRWSRIRKA